MPVKQLVSTIIFVLILLMLQSTANAEPKTLHYQTNEDLATFALEAAKKQNDIMQSNNIEGLKSTDPKKLKINTIEDLEKVLLPFYTKQYIKRLWDDETMNGLYKFPKPHMWECDIANAINLKVTEKSTNKIVISGDVECAEDKCKSKSTLILTPDGWRVDEELCGSQ